MNRSILKATDDQKKEMTQAQLFLNLAFLLTPDERLKVFEEYCRVLEKRVPERVSIETGIKRNNVYRYLPRTQSKIGGNIPEPEPTAKIIMALALKHHEYDFVINILQPARDRMRISYLKFDDWSKIFRNKPYTLEEIVKLERSLPGLKSEDSR